MQPRKTVVPVLANCRGSQCALWRSLPKDTGRQGQCSLGRNVSQAFDDPALER